MMASSTHVILKIVIFACLIGSGNAFIFSLIEGIMNVALYAANKAMAYAKNPDGTSENRKLRMLVAQMKENDAARLLKPFNWTQWEIDNAAPVPPREPLQRCAMTHTNPVEDHVYKPKLANSDVGSGWVYHEGHLGALVAFEICLSVTLRDFYIKFYVINQRSIRSSYIITPSYNNLTKCDAMTVHGPYKIKCFQFIDFSKNLCSSASLETVVPLNTSARGLTYMVEYTVTSGDYRATRCVYIDPVFHANRSDTIDDNAGDSASNPKSFVDCNGFGILACFLSSLTTALIMYSLSPEGYVTIRYDIGGMERLRQVRLVEERKQKMNELKIILGKDADDGSTVTTINSRTDTTRKYTAGGKPDAAEETTERTTSHQLNIKRNKRNSNKLKTIQE